MSSPEHAGQPAQRRIDPSVARRYRDAGWWGDRTVGQCVADHAGRRPEAPAFITVHQRCSWQAYDQAANRVGSALLGAGVGRDARVAVLLPDGAAVHAVFVGAERVGATVVGVGHRAGDREIQHLLGKTGATVLVTAAQRGAEPASALYDRLRRGGLGLTHHLVVTDGVAGPDEIILDGDTVPGPPSPLPGDRAYGPDDLFLLNSTSGTTGLPKCVMHTQNRWFYFHLVAVDAGDFTPADVFLSAIPAPFGFGLWTAHFTPAILGSPTIVAERFDAGSTLDLIEQEHVTVLACVSTQFIMMLNEQEARPRDLSSLRCMFTGGEAVPYERAAEFEERTGAAVLQFYGSNETGALSRTTSRDTRQRRLGTAGRVIEEMQVRLFDEDGSDITGRGRPGVPGCKGPATCIGYYDDEVANAALFTPDGWMLMGDIVEVDDDSYLRVVGRVSDFIIRGGKNISAPAVEQEVGTHPGVAMVAAVAMPDPTFGERVCVYVETRPGWETLTLEDLSAHLGARGVTKEWFPERLIVVAELPRSSGGKVAKGELREDIRRRFDAGNTTSEGGLG